LEEAIGWRERTLKKQCHHAQEHREQNTGEKMMRKFWVFIAAGVFSFGLLFAQAIAKDIDKIEKTDELDKLERKLIQLDKQDRLDKPKSIDKQLDMRAILPVRSMDPGAQ
jgi:heme/copper-type cytochrome/quinol oxidase subunit 3